VQATNHAGTGRVVPPAPKVHAKDLPAWRIVRDFTQNTVSSWPDYAFDVPIYQRRIFGIDGVLINDPDGVRHAMATTAQNYTRPVAFVRIFRPFVGNGLILAEGAEWRAQRRMLAPVLTPASVGRLLPHFQLAADDLVRRLDGQPTANLSAAFQDATLEAVLRALFTLADVDRRQQLAGMVRRYMAGPGKPTILDGFSRSERSWSWAQRGRRAFQGKWFAAVDEIVAERKARGTSDQPADLLDLLLAARDADSAERLSERQVRDQCATMLLAGFETTSRLLFWACYLLCLDQTEQVRLRAEIAAFPPAQASTLDDLSRWPSVREMLLETLRLYPSVPLLTREAIEHDTVLGIKIKPGAQIFISPWVIHRHRKYWEQPNAFIPARFKDKPQPWTSGSFMPFGAEPRICIGAAFAMAKAEIMLATLLSRFRISLADTAPELPIGRITTMPGHEPQFRLEAVR
jgi:cytochrome P450